MLTANLSFLYPPIVCSVFLSRLNVAADINPNFFQLFLSVANVRNYLCPPGGIILPYHYVNVRLSSGGGGAAVGRREDEGRHHGQY